ncbi:MULTISPECIES: 3'-5' exonuclease [unclassified Neptuniibacter]|uniref:3'-5' exonuclease n=1 Tax=unclassified Neptuniibacter TaxID=2630693 RepID=UPI000C4B700C|nr:MULTISPECIES: 3'-5' exonuclease [unclassified Neptuniibacter]MAY41712.1 DNA polymerase III subunit epsilon [Oceanospirillaceae bacterium]|tara:strand:- start:1087 stop:1653 length:567 start_codon:yes stop_codon:yes gene_type:complete
MKTILFYDTETTGLPVWKEPSDSEAQPHLVQLGAVLANAETKEVISTLDVIIKPEGWEIPEEVSAIHGITTEHAQAVGVPEHLAFEMLIAMAGDAERVAYNKTFDQRIIRIAAKRYSTEEVQEKWAVKDDHHCSMRMAQSIIGGKNPKLIDAYQHFTGKDLENAHSAMADTLACMEVYWAVLALDEAA